MQALHRIRTSLFLSSPRTNKPLFHLSLLSCSKNMSSGGRRAAKLQWMPKATTPPSNSNPVSAPISISSPQSVASIPKDSVHSNGSRSDSSDAHARNSSTSALFEQNGKVTKSKHPLEDAKRDDGQSNIPSNMENSVRRNKRGSIFTGSVQSVPSTSDVAGGTSPIGALQSPGRPVSHLQRVEPGALHKNSMLSNDISPGSSGKIKRFSAGGASPSDHKVLVQKTENVRGMRQRFSDNGIQYDRVQRQKALQNVSNDQLLQSVECCHSFDICPSQENGPVKLNISIIEKNRGKKMQEASPLISDLRPGMILMKGYISYDDQVKIIKECRELGINSGGFYQPGYSDGAKLRLHMMCLGKNWDPETRSYGDKRPIDDAFPPFIPESFSRLVQTAIQYARDFIKNKRPSVRLVEAVLPSMKPDICIVNFYANTGKLGLHQDRDESPESLNHGLPVVSFSLGDSAEFLYGDDRDVDQASKVTLESGDVLIFGGKSRHIFHGVRCIQPNTAPRLLVNDTGLRPGRLNLTFRQY